MGGQMAGYTDSAHLLCWPGPFLLQAAAGACCCFGKHAPDQNLTTQAGNQEMCVPSVLEPWHGTIRSACWSVAAFASCDPHRSMACLSPLSWPPSSPLPPMWGR